MPDEFTIEDLEYLRVGSTPLLNRLLPNFGLYLEFEDRNEVARRALVQVLAIRAWQLRHGGTFPDRLEALVPDELPSLPSDPYSGRPFGYISQAQSRRIWPDSLAEKRLLYSVGPDHTDDQGMPLDRSPKTGAYDIVFPIPPLSSLTTGH